ncbi:hypothetical protein BC830DRAFT_1083799, partial [Chytriomyces sp. MP71]
RRILAIRAVTAESSSANTIQLTDKTIRAKIVSTRAYGPNNCCLVHSTRRNRNTSSGGRTRVHNITESSTARTSTRLGGDAHEALVQTNARISIAHTLLRKLRAGTLERCCTSRLPTGGWDCARWLPIRRPADLALHTECPTTFAYLSGCDDGVPVADSRAAADAVRIRVRLGGIRNASLRCIKTRAVREVSVARRSAADGFALQPIVANAASRADASAARASSVVGSLQTHWPSPDGGHADEPQAGAGFPPDKHTLHRPLADPSAAGTQRLSPVVAGQTHELSAFEGHEAYPQTGRALDSARRDDDPGQK